MAYGITFEPCVDGCSIPANKYDNCLPVTKKGAIVKALFSCEPLATDFPDMCEPDQAIWDTFNAALETELISRIDNGQTDFANNPDLIREWRTETEYPTSEDEIIDESPCYDSEVVARTWTMEILVKELTQANEKFARYVQAAKRIPVRMWFVYKNGDIEGGEAGIDGAFVNAVKSTNGVDNTSQHTITFTFEWKADCMADIHPTTLPDPCKLLVETNQAAL